MGTRRRSVIRASEVGEYVYCARSWWLRRVEGLEPEGQERRDHGTALHWQHGRAVLGSQLLLLCGLALLVAGVVLFFISW